VFAAPRGFVKALRELGVVDLEVDEVRLPGQADDMFTQNSAWNQENLPVSATVPPLGLSNKATSDGQAPSFEPDSPAIFSLTFPSPSVSISASRRPFEAELASVKPMARVKRYLVTATR